MSYVFEERTNQFLICQNQCLIRHLIRGSNLLFCCHQSAFVTGWREEGVLAACVHSAVLLCFQSTNLSTSARHFFPFFRLLVPLGHHGDTNHCETSHLIQEERFQAIVMGGAVCLPARNSNVKKGFAHTNGDL